MAKILKENKTFYYIKSYFRFLTSVKPYQQRIAFLEKKLSPAQLEQAEKRINYYNKLSEKDFPFETSKTIKDLKKPVSPKTYFHDTYEYARFFDENLGINYVFGDVIEVPPVPSIVKSRPISENNQNSVLLNLDKARHFVWVKNDKPFLEKKNMLIGRGAVFQEHRFRFYEKYFEHPLCDLGHVHRKSNEFLDIWIKPKVSLQDHLDYKFILCLQGNDVATNLKWVMSSNSIAVMPKPKYETWFMEGKLIGGKHFIEIRQDYSDLEEQLNFYISNPEKCLEIIKNANEFCSQFFNKDLEDYCSLKVLEKYLMN